MIKIVLTLGTDRTSLRDRVFEHFENHAARDYVTDEVLLANLPDLDDFLDEHPCLSIQFSSGEDAIYESVDQLDEDAVVALEELVDRIADNIHAAWVDPADVVRDLVIGWDADVFELDGEDDDWEGFLLAVADEVVMSSLTHDGRVGEAIYDPVDASQYRGALG